jgi:hypothetical protein
MSGLPPQRRAFVIPGLKRRVAAPPAAVAAPAAGAEGSSTPGAPLGAAAHAAKRFKSLVPAGLDGAAAANQQVAGALKENTQPAGSACSKHVLPYADGAGTDSPGAHAAPGGVEATVAAAPAPLALAMPRQGGFRPPSMVRPFKPPGAQQPAGAAADAYARGTGTAGQAGGAAGAVAVRGPEGPSTVFAVLFTKVRSRAWVL